MRAEGNELHIGFTGTQRGMTDAQYLTVDRIFGGFGDFILHHGDCDGADRQSHILARKRGARIHLHPPGISLKRAFCQLNPTDRSEHPKPYLERNRDIAAACTTLIATPGEIQEQLRSGTWSTVRYARKIGRKIIVVLPSGEAQIEVMDLT